MGVVSRSTNGPGRPRGAAPQILAPVGVDDRPALLPRESDRLTVLIDRLAAEVVLRHATGRRVLDLGRGAPELYDWVVDRVDRLDVVDAVDLGRGGSFRVPLPSASYDCIYSLRTLPHLGRDPATSQQALDEALREVGRLLVPGGVAVLQLDNALSPIGLFHGLRRWGRGKKKEALVVQEVGRGVTRFDVLGRVIERLPESLTPTDLHGLRLVVASPHLLSVPLVGRILSRLEWMVRDQPLLRRFAAHLLLVVRRVTPPRETDPGPV